jgi:hypothetical protein
VAVLGSLAGLFGEMGAVSVGCAASSHEHDADALTWVL